MSRNRKSGSALRTALSLLGYFLVPIVILLASPWWLLLAIVAMVVAFVAFTRPGQQILSVIQIGVATIPQRIGSSSVVVVGIAGVVAVLVALLAMSQGFAQTLKETGSDDTAIVLRAGSNTELNSVLDHETAV